MKLEFTETAWEDFNYWLDQGEKTIINRIRDLITSITRTSTKGLGKPEPLKHEFKGYWSRRINKGHRLVYQVSGKRGLDQKCVIIQCRYHYDKK